MDKSKLALIAAASVVLLLSGCTTPNDEAHVERLMRHRSWPRIEQVATAEVTRREKLLGWPDNALYLPSEHKDKVWAVAAMAGTPNGDVRRVVTLLIGDDGDVLVYKRSWEGQ
jgi:hypothetical protein